MLEKGSNIGLLNHKNRGIKMTSALEHPPGGWGVVARPYDLMPEICRPYDLIEILGFWGAAGG